MKSKSKTFYAKKSEIESNWYLVDASEGNVGRICSQIAQRLQGKNKPYYSPNVFCGDKIIVINSDKINFSGGKLTKKKYIRHTGYPGGQKSETPENLLNKGFSDRIITHAVKGMLPKNKLEALCSQI